MKHTSFRSEIILMCVFCVSVPLLVAGIYTFVVMYNSVSSNLNTELTRVLENDNAMSEKNINSTMNFATRLMSDEDIRSALKMGSSNSDNTSLGRAKTRAAISKAVENIAQFDSVWNNGLILSVSFCQTVNGGSTQYYYHNQNVVNNISNEELVSEVYLESLDNGFSVFFEEPSDTDDIIYLIWNVRDESLRYLGKLVVALSGNHFLSEYDNILLLYDRSFVFFSDIYGNVLVGHDNEDEKPVADAIVDNAALTGELREFYYDDSRYAISTHSYMRGSLRVSTVIPSEQLYGLLFQTASQYTVIMSALIIAFVFIVVKLSQTFVQPIIELRNNVESITSETDLTDAPRYREDEIDVLATTFYTLLARIRTLNQEIYEKQLLLKQEEMSTLMSQINPHFIFNVLQSVSWKAAEIGSADISNTVNDLSSLIRTNLSMSGKEKITLRDELKYIRFYLDLQEERFGKRLRSEITVESEELYDYLIPKLCVQSLVENSVTHGIESKIEGGMVTIEASEEDGELLLIVRDDGTGFDDSAQLWKEQPKTGSKFGFGLHNVYARMLLMYDGSDRMEIKSSPEKGTRVAMRIPKEKG